MERKVHKLLREMAEKKSYTLNENVKIFKTPPVRNKKQGEGYWLYVSSDNPSGEIAGQETKDFANKMNFTKNAIKAKKWKHDFIPPQWAMIDKETGQFGWGYFITKVRENMPGAVDKLFSNLKTLVRDYNTSKNLEQDAESGDLTVAQIGQIQNLTSAIEDTLATEMNAETKAKLEKYLDDLSIAIEKDEVFEFLTEKYEEASKFKATNQSAGHKYTISNAMIILAAQPNAVLAAQRGFWEGRNYRVKEGSEHGIHISIPRTTKTADTARAMQSNSSAWNDYKKQQGIDQGVSYSQHIKANPKKNNADVAYDAISKKLVQTSFGKFAWGTVYTDTMVEPIPGLEAPTIEELLGTPDNGKDAFHISQKELDSDVQRQKLINLFDALEDVTQKAKINTSGFAFKKDSINDFNNVLNALAYEEFSRSMSKSIGADNMDKDTLEEMLNGYAEVISNLVKKHYGIPSEESKYNAARQGIDREEIQKAYSAVIRISHKIIEALEKSLNTNEPVAESLAEVREFVKRVLRNK